MNKLGLVATFLLGCAPTISTVNTNPSPRPLSARPVSEIEVFTTKLPSRPYVEVAVFTASKGKAADHIDALRERAANHGCDALVFTRMPSESTHASSGGQPGEMSTTTQSVGSSSATCVVWNDAAPSSAIDPAAMPASAPAQ